MSTLKTQKSAPKTLEEREEEYKKMNAALEAQTAQLVKEADQVMKDQDDFLQLTTSKTPDQIELNPTNISEDIRRDLDSFRSDEDLFKIAASGFDDLFTSVSSPRQRPSTSLKKVPKSSFVRKTVSATSVKRSTAPKSRIEVDANDILPQVASNMASEAQIRLLKAKVKVLQEELSATSEDLKSEIESHKKSKITLKEALEDLEKMRKTSNTQQNSIQKLKTQTEENKKLIESKSFQLQAANKELESFKKQQKQQKSSQSASEVRLNRALEEVDKLKSALKKEKNNSKENHEKLVKDIESAKSSNKKLERVKSEMENLLKKQQALIGVLKKQIVHIEAAKLLSFSEEEFLKALDWDKV